MDERELQRVMDRAIRRTIEKQSAGKPVPRLIQLCRIQAEAAERLHALHRAGVIGRYTMPSVVQEPPGGDGVVIRSDFDYIEGHGDME